MAFERQEVRMARPPNVQDIRTARSPNGIRTARHALNRLLTDHDVPAPQSDRAPLLHLEALLVADRLR